MTNATLVGAYSGNSGSSSAASVSCTLTSVQAGDLVLALVCIERSTATAGTPVTGAANAFTSDANTANTSMAWSFSHYVLTSADVSGGSCTITSTCSTSTRRQAIDAIVFRDTSVSALQFQAGTYTQNADGVVTATAPSITPSADDATIVCLFASISNVSPFIRTQSIDSPYTIEGNNGSTAAASTNAYVTGSKRALTGGGGASQTGATMNDTTSPTPTKFHWFAGTYSVGAVSGLNWEFTDSAGLTDPGEMDSIGIEGSDAVGLTDDMTFTLPDAIADGTTASYQVLIDWAGDGSFGDPGDDVSTRTLTERGQLSIQRGRDVARTDEDISAGQAAMLLNNASRDYSPENVAGPLAGQLGPGREILARATFGSYTFNLFRGFLDDYVVKPTSADLSVDLTCLDGLGRFAQIEISTPLYQGVTTGQAIGYVLDAAGWPTARRDIDQGHTAIAWWWEDGVTALDALRRLVRAEGLPSLIYMNGEGQVVFRDRTHRFIRPTSAGAQAVFAGGGDEPQALDAGFTYDAGWKALANKVDIDIPIRACDGIPVPVWSTDTPFTLSTGETIQVIARSSDPFLGAVVPEAGTDFTATGSGVSCSLDRDSGSTVTISVTATSAVTVLSMQLRACPVPVTTTAHVTVSNAASISANGLRSYPHDVPWVNANDAFAIANTILMYYADRLPVITFNVSGNSTRMLQQLARQLSDQITVSEENSGINGSFFIEHIRHTITHGATSHITEFACEQAPAQVTNPFRFDTAGAGFNQGLFAKDGGIFTPLFQFDVDGSGFDDGLLAG